MSLRSALLSGMLTILGAAASHAQPQREDLLLATNLRVEHLLHPDFSVVNGYPSVGSDSNPKVLVGNRQPIFGWQVQGSGERAFQSAYRIIVSGHADSIATGVGDVWDSGRVASGESINIRYGGKALQPRTDYVWRVMLWDRQGGPSPWSATGRFRTADTLRDYRTAYYPIQKTDESPSRIVRENGVTQIDFGRASFGQLRLTLTTEAPSDTVVVHLGEALLPDGRINSRPGGTIRYAAYRIPLMRGRHTYYVHFRPDKRNTGPQAVRMPAYIGEVMPFRYVELEGYGREVQKADITRATVHYPFDEQASYFESPDTVLNAVWDLCKYSIKATSFAGIYVDGDRERIPYEADAYINQLCHYGVDHEYSMARRSHEYLLHHATWPTEWILQSVLMAYNDYLYTGDARSAEHHYDVLKAKLLLPLREANGLISTKTGKQTRTLMDAIHYKGDSLRDIVDWPHTGGFGMVGNGETDGFVFTPFNSVVNAFHYKALRDMTHLANALGHTGDAAIFSQKAAETYRAFQRLLWDKRQGAYRDGIGTDHASLHTNMMAMAFGLVPEQRTQEVAAFIRSRGMACSVYGSQFLMDAVYEAGDAAYGLSLLTSRDDRSWYNMIRAGSTITMEAWDNKYKPNQDWNHAWGAVPANAIPRKLMGVEPLLPGWNAFRVRPQLGPLAWARVKVPTIKGAVELSCRQGDGTYRMELKVPGNTEAHVEIPAVQRGRVSVTVNDAVVKADDRGGYIVLAPLAPGNYVIEVKNK
jgi:Neutral trehalase